MKIAAGILVVLIVLFFTVPMVAGGSELVPIDRTDWRLV
jgi:hypothetical protein